MKEEHLNVKTKRRRGYSSYLGEQYPVPENIMNRDFKTDRTYQKRLNDITEFTILYYTIPNGKVYLSVIKDCYNNEIIATKLGTSPNAELVYSTLIDAIQAIDGKELEGLVLHGDRGIHYRWSEWIEIIKKYGITRSMSKKGCILDNAICEGVFGRFKNESFYNYSFTIYTIPEFLKYMLDYIHWYNNDRI